MVFKLFNQDTGGAQVGQTITHDNVGFHWPPVRVSAGLFAVELDFGGVFPGADRYLEIAVRPHGTGPYTTLAPRQALLPTPYAILAEFAG